MKKRNFGVHIGYLLCIGLILSVVAALLFHLNEERRQLLAESDGIREEADRQWEDAVKGAEDALRTAIHTENPAVYAEKMQRLAEMSVEAQLLTEQRFPTSVWQILFTHLTEFAENEVKNMVAQQALSQNRGELLRFAELLHRLRENPKALDGPLWDDLPQLLQLPKLQTEFSLGSDQLRSDAGRLLGVTGGLLKEDKSGLAGIVRFTCANAEVEMLCSGAPAYLALRLPRKEGTVSQSERFRQLLEFAKVAGVGDAEITELYEKNGLLWMKLAPVVKTALLGSVKDLDRSVTVACTLWSGKVCYFKNEAIYRKGQGEPDEKWGMTFQSGKWLSEKQLQKIAERYQAAVGEPVIYKGRVCYTLLFEKEKDGGQVTLYLDASDGSECDLVLCYPPSEKWEGTDEKQVIKSQETLKIVPKSELFGKSS